MSAKSTLQYNSGLSFDVELNGHTFAIDADPKYGGQNRGPKPMPMLLSALGGCSGMDVVSILHKMKYEDFELNIEVEGEYSQGDHPHVYETIQIAYTFKGELDPEKLKKAVELSMTRYCGVMAMLSKAADVSWKIVLNGEEVA